MPDPVSIFVGLAGDEAWRYHTQILDVMENAGSDLKKLSKELTRVQRDFHFGRTAKTQSARSATSRMA